MKWTVVWTPVALDDLTSIWLQSLMRADVTSSSYRIGVSLRNHPESIGESREGDERILIDSPLAVKYRVINDDCLVEVIGVWQV